MLIAPDALRSPRFLKRAWPSATPQMIRCGQPRHQPGSIPFALMTAAAAGVLKKLTNAFAASGCFEFVGMPAINTVYACRSSGNVPAISTSAEAAMKLAFAITRSASPLATVWKAASVFAASLVFGFISVAIPSRSNIRSACMAAGDP